MRTLLEIREYMKGFWSRYSQAVTIGVKFLITLLALNLINSRIGYNEQLAGILPTLLISLLCSLIPYGAICGILAVVILVHLWSLSVFPLFAGGRYTHHPYAASVGDRHSICDSDCGGTALHTGIDYFRDFRNHHPVDSHLRPGQ